MRETGCVLFPPPPSKLPVSRSISSRSPVVSAGNSRSRMTPKTVSAFRLSPTATFGSSDHLSPFALWPALPTADYSGDSVALGVAPRGSITCSLVHHVVARFRSSTHPYPRTRCPMSHSRATVFALANRFQAVDLPSPSSVTTLASVLDRAVPDPSGGCRVVGALQLPPGWDFRQWSLDHAARAMQSESSAGGWLLRFSGRLCSP